MLSREFVLRDEHVYYWAGLQHQLPQYFLIYLHTRPQLEVARTDDFREHLRVEVSDITGGLLITFLQRSTSSETLDVRLCAQKESKAGLYSFHSPQGSAVGPSCTELQTLGSLPLPWLGKKENV